MSNCHSVICGVGLCYCDVCPNATVQFLGRETQVILTLERTELHCDYKEVDCEQDVRTVCGARGGGGGCCGRGVGGGEE